MASTITAGNATNGLAVSCDNTGILELKTGTGSGTTAVTIGTGQNVTFAQVANLPNTFGFKNRIINGAMGIWQRGTSSSTLGAYVADRWAINSGTSVTATRSTDVPSGFQYSLSLSGTNFPQTYQRIESLNCVDLPGQTITVSFWAKQTSGAAVNSLAVALAAPNTTDNYAAVTGIGTNQLFTGSTSWVQYTATYTNVNALIANGLQVLIFANTSGAATFLVTGVQLEKGSTATSFDYRPYGTELALCQRYYFRFNASESNWLGGAGYSGTSTTARVPITFPVQMRTPPTAIDTTGTASNYRVLPANIALSVVPALNLANQTDGWLSLTVASGLTGNAVATLAANAGISTAFIGWSAEL